MGRTPFVAAVSSPPFRRRRFVAIAISSRGHFVANHFVARTLLRHPIRREDTLPRVIMSQGHFVAPPFRRGDTSSTEDDDYERTFLIHNTCIAS